MTAALLRVQGLTKAFGAHRAVDGISFDLAPGEILALIGPNGAGKTTSFNMINGQLRADAGSVLYDGQAVLGRSPHAIARMGVGRSFQVAASFSSLSVCENVQMAFIAHHRQIYRFWTRAGSRWAEQSRALLAQVGLAGEAERICRELAYGDVKRLELAMALAGEPRLLLMDEPTAGMAPGERQELMALVCRLAQARNMAVLFTEHSMDVVFAHARRIIVMAGGRIVANGPPEAVRADPQVQRVYFGHAEAAS
ncbi:MAG: ABC transporter ATP-binding protein [Castellaniella sp.]